MADELYLGGKLASMNTGIVNEIGAMKIYNASGTAIVNSVTGLSASDFTVNSSTGILTNDSAITFTIASGDIGKTLTYVVLQNSAQTVNLLRLDLETSVELTTAGEAEFAAGELNFSYASTV